MAQPSAGLIAVPVFRQPQFITPRRLDAVTIAVSTWCNLQCRGCGRTLGIKNGRWENRYIAKEDFTRIVAHLPPTKLGILQGVGEPTMHPDFLELCRLAKESARFDKLMFHTNGVTRDTDYLRQLSAYVDQINVSIDTLNDAFVAVTRVGTDVRKLRRRLEELSAIGVKVGINMVVSRYNIMDIPSTLKILDGIGVFDVRMQPFDGGDEEDGMLTQSESALLKRVLKDLQPFAPNITIEFADLSEEPTDGTVLCRANAPALAPYVLPDGHLTPCCRSDNPAKLGYANLARDSFETIWQSPSVRRYVHEFIEDGDLMCNGCPKNHRTALPGQNGFENRSDAIEQLLKPAVAFALSINDFMQAERFCDEFAIFASDHPELNAVRAEVLKNRDSKLA